MAATIYTYLIREKATGSLDTHSTTNRNGCPPGWEIVRELEHFDFPPKPYGEPEKKPEKKTFWQWLFGSND